VSTLPLILPSFAAGELSPFLYGRVDLAKFHVGCRTLLNMLVHPHGGASNRPGTRFVGQVDDSTVRHRLIPFKFRASPGGQNYVLVFGHMAMQVVMNTGTAIGFVNDSPGHVYTLATPYAAADLPKLKFVQSADTMTLTHPSYAPRKLTRTGHAAWQLTQITFAPATPAPTGLAANSPGSAVSVELTAINDSNGEESLPSAPAGSTGSSDAWTWAAVSGCTNYNIYKKNGSIYGFVAQVTTNSWTDNNLAPDIGNTPPGQRNPFGANKITAVTVTHGGSGYNSPTVKAVDNAGSGAAFTAHVSGGVITSVDVNSQGLNYSSNATLQVSDGGGTGALIQLNFGDDGTDGVHYLISSATVLAGGSGYHAGAYALVIQPGGSNDGATLALTLSGGAVTACTVTNGGYGFSPYFPFPYAQVFDSAGSGAALTPTLTPDTTTYPGCSTYYQQRQAFAGTSALPQTLWFSVTGAFNNKKVSQPTKDDDAITRTLTSREVNEIRHLMPAGSSMLALTSGAEWRVYPGANASGLTPASCVTLPQTAYGTSHVPPIWSDNSLLFVQERGSRVRELRFDALQDQYQSSDMSVLSQHLLYDTAAQYQIQEWAFAEEPFRVVWCVRSDGVLLGFTYMREHQVYAWHRHTTDGRVESVATIAEPDGAGGYVDAVYLVVERLIGGVVKRYVERMVERTFARIEDAWFVDCGLQYVAANTNVSHTVTIRASGFDLSYAAGATLLSVIMANSAPFTQDCVGRVLTARSGTDSVQVLITQIVDGSNAYGTLLQDCPASLQNVATSNWTLPSLTAVTSVSGLGHLEGKTVAILGDGSVVPSQAVNGGAITLDGPYTKLTIGLPYTADLETLNLELPAGGTVQGQMKKIGQITVRAKDARGIQVGLNQTAVTEVKQRSSETLGSAMQPYNGDWAVTIPSEWNRDGRLFVRQAYPLPCTILDLIPEVNVGR